MTHMPTSPRSSAPAERLSRPNGATRPRSSEALLREIGATGRALLQGSLVTLINVYFELFNDRLVERAVAYAVGR
jgi:hypothetical protein